jgi:pyruvate kinase
MEPPRRAKIVATLGPATDGRERELVAAGLDVARLNFSHGDRAAHRQRCLAIRAAAAELDRGVAVMQDLPGPKIRIGRLRGGKPIALAPGQKLVIAADDSIGRAGRVSTGYRDLPRDVRPGDAVYLDDGRLRLRVTDVRGAEVLTVVEEGGQLAEHKGINLPGVAVSAPALTEEDADALRFGLRELAVDLVALSFVRSAEEVRAARRIVREVGATAGLIAKLEKGEAIDRLGAILAAADGVMVARGDLGVELPPERVPLLQKTIIRRANAAGKPVICATHMLESMVSDDAPTRAEVGDVANAVWDGADAVMLSAETAVGANPRLAVEMMDRIVRAAESDAGRVAGRVGASTVSPRRNAAAAVTAAARVLAEQLGARCIAAITRTGRTAELLAADRPRVPIYAFAPDERVCRRLALWWGVTPLRLSGATIGPELLHRGYAARGDTIVVVGSQPMRRGVHTNFVRYQVL